MFLLPAKLRRLLETRKDADGGLHVYASDQELVLAVRKVARQQGRTEEDVFTEFARAGKDLFINQDSLSERWGALSEREQEVLALVCLGFHNHQIAEKLSISHPTVKSHLQNIFYKYNLRSTKELRYALKDWQFQEWWDERHS